MKGFSAVLFFLIYLILNRTGVLNNTSSLLVSILISVAVNVLVKLLRKDTSEKKSARRQDKDYVLPVSRAAYPPVQMQNLNYEQTAAEQDAEEQTDRAKDDGIYGNTRFREEDGGPQKQRFGRIEMKKRKNNVEEPVYPPSGMRGDPWDRK